MSASVGRPTADDAATLRRKARSALTWGLALLAILTIVAVGSRNYLYQFFHGPFVYDDAAILEAAAQPGDRSLLAYVELRERRLLPTDSVELTTVDDAVHTSFPYFLTPVGEKYLLVLAREGEGGQRMLGPLNRVTRDVDLSVMAAIEERTPAYRGRLLPVMLNATAAFNVWGYLLLTAGIPLALATAWKLSRAALLYRRAAVAENGSPRQNG